MPCIYKAFLFKIMTKIIGMNKQKLSRGYETRFDFTKLQKYMINHHISRRVLCDKANISDETLSKVLNGYSVCTSTIDNVLAGLDKCEPSRKHKLSDICIHK